MKVSGFVLFGLRSPLVVDYEISAARAARAIIFGVSVTGHPRILGEMRVVTLATLDETSLPPALPCAFSPKRREELALEAADAGFALADTLIDPTSILPPQFRIGLGGFVNAGAVIGGGCVFGESVLINRSASIGHHTVLGDYVSIGPGAVLSGNVRVGQHSVIGAGAIIQSGVRIGDNALVSAGSVVRKHVKDGALVAGNPAKQMPFRARQSSLDLTGGE